MRPARSTSAAAATCGRTRPRRWAAPGRKRARIMLVGEQPGDQEDLAGEPFVGPAGKLLDRAMARRRTGPAQGVPDQCGQALQVGAARQAAPAQDARAARDRRVQLLAGQRTGQQVAAGCRGRARQHRAQGRHRRPARHAQGCDGQAVRAPGQVDRRRPTTPATCCACRARTPRRRRSRTWPVRCAKRSRCLPRPRPGRATGAGPAARGAFVFRTAEFVLRHLPLF